VVLLILELPIDNEPRGQLMSLLGILVTAAVALSSTTFLGNAMAGVMLRSIRNFKAGDFIVVDGHRGRVSELGLLRTEIQTERRNLTTFPNLFLVTNPVTVVRGSGTFISATVSLGYDVPREKVEKHLAEAAHHAGLTDPFVFVLELGDFSITYQVAGFLEEVKYLISAESELRECMLDSLHHAGIEIVSPTFMNTRALSPGQDVLPPATAVRSSREEVEARPPEDVVFDKAEKAEQIEDLAARHVRLDEQIEALEEEAKAAQTDEERQGIEKRIEKLETAREQLGLIIERARKSHDEN